MNELALFAGIGGGILAGKEHGWKCVCAVEIDPYCRSVLMARQNDGLLPPFPIWDDVCTFDGKPWRGVVDVVSGGFPCQDISQAGNRAGIEGTRSGLWSEMYRIVGEVRPRYVFVENVAALLVRGIDRVLGDLAALRYDCKWGMLGAADVGAPHRRDRLWLLATDAECIELWQPAGGRRGENGESSTQSGNDGKEGFVANTYSSRKLQPQGDECEKRKWACDSVWWVTEPDVGRVVNGVPFRVDRLKALGNAQVPQCAAEAIEILMVYE